jgi:hypothetical protein
MIAPARHQKPRPVGRDLAPELFLRALLHEGALGAIALDQVLALELAQRLADGGARHAAFGREVLDGRDLRADVPFAGLDATAEQARELDVARDCAAAQINPRRFGCGLSGHGNLLGENLLLRRGSGARQESCRGRGRGG